MTNNIANNDHEYDNYTRYYGKVTIICNINIHSMQLYSHLLSLISVILTTKTSTVTSINTSNGYAVTPNQCSMHFTVSSIWSRHLANIDKVNHHFLLYIKSVDPSRKHFFIICRELHTYSTTQQDNTISVSMDNKLQYCTLTIRDGKEAELR